MFANSRPVSSNQSGPHPDLPVLLQRHCQSPFRKPIATHTLQAFEVFLEAWENAGRLPLVLDAGCGTGASTERLSQRHPGHFVLGVDQSEHRLQRGPESAAHLLTLRADVVDVWRLLHAKGITLAHHYLLYPNPWPKKRHLARRWHGHAAFPVALALSGSIECRSNWSVYAEEFALALQQLTGTAVRAEPLHADALEVPLTPFEHKYRDSGHALWRCRLDLTQSPTTAAPAPFVH